VKARVAAPRVPRITEAGGARARLPAGLAEALTEAVAARERVLAQHTTASIVAALGAAVARFSERICGPRAPALVELARHAALDPGMVARGLKACLEAANERAMLELVQAEAEDPVALDRAVVTGDGALARLLGPRIVVHRLAGNVPGLAVAPAVAGLIARSVCVVRESRRQPSLLPGLREELRTLAPDLAAMLISARWEALDRPADQAVDEIADRVELYGSNATVAELRPLYRSAEIVERSDRLSVGLVPRRRRQPDWAQGFAEDISMYEGRGCLTPRAICVEGGLADAREAAGELGAALRALARQWPRVRQSDELEALRRSFLGNAEISALAHPGESLLVGDDDGWAIHVCERVPFEPGPGLRCVRLLPAADLRALLAELARIEPPLAGIGIADGTGSAGLIAAAQGQEALRAAWVCPAGQMQAPPLSWQQDGRRRLGDLLRWQVQPT
jgi:hypothetical protein